MVLMSRSPYPVPKVAVWFEKESVTRLPFCFPLSVRWSSSFKETSQIYEKVL